jgi:hypothetical protein
MMTHTCNPSYSGGGGRRRTVSLKPGHIPAPSGDVLEMYIRRLHFGPESETLEMKSSNLLLQMLSVIQTYVQV